MHDPSIVPSTWFGHLNIVPPLDSIERRAKELSSSSDSLISSTILVACDSSCVRTAMEGGSPMKNTMGWAFSLTQLQKVLQKQQLESGKLVHMSDEQESTSDHQTRLPKPPEVVYCWLLLVGCSVSTSCE
jgi:hypothetical protein